MTTTGRNDPCPCGSGKKFKRCCLHARRGDGWAAPTKAPTSGSTSGWSVVSDRLADVRAAVDGAVNAAKPASEAELQSLLGAVMERQNIWPIDDFAGLSSERMFALMHRAGDSPTLVELPDLLDDEPHTPALNLFEFLVAGVTDSGLLLTQKGNLPRKLVQEIHAADLLPEVLDPFRPYAGVPRSEDDLHFLVELRQSAMFAGLFETDGRRLRRTLLLDRLIAQGDHRRVYSSLLASRALEWNWAYGDRYAELEIVQQAWLFSLYSIARVPAGESAVASELAAAFVRAFSMALDETDDPWPQQSLEGAVAKCRTHRTLYRFAGPLGLVTLAAVGERPRLAEDFRVTPTPLLYDAVRFCLKLT